MIIIILCTILRGLAPQPYFKKTQKCLTQHQHKRFNWIKVIQEFQGLTLQEQSLKISEVTYRTLFEEGISIVDINILLDSVNNTLPQPTEPFKVWLESIINKMLHQKIDWKEKVRLKEMRLLHNLTWKNSLLFRPFLCCPESPISQRI